MNDVRQLDIGAAAPPFEVRALDGTQVMIPDPSRIVHLQFRRFAGCPICNLHLRSVAKRIADLHRAQIHEIAVFHSEAETMRAFQRDLPFDVVADPERHLYTAYGVTGGAKSVLDPRAWPAFVKGVLARHPSSTFTGEGGHTGLPADFLIAPDGRIRARHYGRHADDQWSVDKVIELATT